jgi:hypothetical protein
MPKLNCLCGTDIDLSPIPNPHGFLIYAEDVYNSFIDDTLGSRHDEITRAELGRRFNAAEVRWRPFLSYECQTCGRLAVLSGDDVIRWSLPDPTDGNPKLVDTATQLAPSRGPRNEEHL